MKYYQLLDTYPTTYRADNNIDQPLRRRRSLKDTQFDIPETQQCSLETVLNQGYWKKNKYLSEIYTKELEKSGSLWRLEFGLFSFEVFNQIFWVIFRNQRTGEPNFKNCKIDQTAKQRHALRLSQQ